MTIIPWNGNSREVGCLKQKCPPWEGYRYFLELHNLKFHSVLLILNHLHLSPVYLYCFLSKVVLGRLHSSPDFSNFPIAETRRKDFLFIDLIEPTKMLLVSGLKSLHTSLRGLALCLFEFQKYSSRSFQKLNNSYNISRTPKQIFYKATRHGNSVNPCYRFSTSQSTNQSRYVRNLDKKISILKTVEEHLDLLRKFRKSVYTADRVAILCRIAKIIDGDKRESLVVELERRKSQWGQHSIYMESLECISQGISRCNAWHLANLMWALGKVHEKDHKLVAVCEREILLHGITSFNSAEICQIVNGCKNLNLVSSDIFAKTEETILNEDICIRDFKIHELSGILASYSKTGKGSAKLFNTFVKEILSRDFSKIGYRALAEFVWSFAKRDFVADSLFHNVEEEIIRRGISDLDNPSLTKLLWAFTKAGCGSKRLFYHLDNELVSSGLKRFDRGVLIEILWSFTKRNATDARVFALVEEEVLHLGVHKFKTHQLVRILFSFISAQRHNPLLASEIESELCLRDILQFTGGDLCQIAWSLGKAGKSDSKLFDIIESQIFQRGVRELPLKESHLLMLMRGFIEAKRGSTRLFEFLTHFFTETDFRCFRESEICECIWCFSEAGFKSGALFDSLEKEILNRDKYFFSGRQIAFIKEGFQRVGRGSRELFAM